MAIVAGVVFIVGAVFFTGFALGRHSDGGSGGHYRGHGDMGPRSAPLMPGMRPGGPMGPMGPDMGRQGPPPPGSRDPGMRPENPPQSAPPPPQSTPPAPR